MHAVWFPNDKLASCRGGCHLGSRRALQCRVLGHAGAHQAEPAAQRRQHGHPHAHHHRQHAGGRARGGRSLSLHSTPGTPPTCTVAPWRASLEFPLLQGAQRGMPRLPSGSVRQRVMGAQTRKLLLHSFPACKRLASEQPLYA